MNVRRDRPAASTESLVRAIAEEFEPYLEAAISGENTGSASFDAGVLGTRDLAAFLAKRAVELVCQFESKLPNPRNE